MNCTPPETTVIKTYPYNWCYGFHMVGGGQISLFIKEEDRWRFQPEQGWGEDPSALQVLHDTVWRCNDSKFYPTSWSSCWALHHLAPPVPRQWDPQGPLLTLDRSWSASASAGGQTPRSQDWTLGAWWQGVSSSGRDKIWNLQNFIILYFQTQFVCAKVKMGWEHDRGHWWQNFHQRYISSICRFSQTM